MMKHSKTVGGTAAAKWLAEAGFMQRDVRKKKDKEDDAAASKAVKGQVNADAERLGLKVVK